MRSGGQTKFETHDRHAPADLAARQSKPETQSVRAGGNYFATGHGGRETQGSTARRVDFAALLGAQR